MKITTEELFRDGGIYFGQTLVRPGECPVKSIAIHRRPHFEEMVAVCVLLTFGDRFFPGISNAGIEFWDAGQESEDGLKHLKGGRLLVGVGDSPLNEHKTISRDEIGGECAATLVAKALAVDEEPALKTLLKHALRSDSKPVEVFDLSSLIKMMHERHPEEPRVVIERVTPILHDFCTTQLEFFSYTAAEFESKASVEWISIPNRNAKVPMVVIISDDERMSKYARMMEGRNAALVIQQNSKGQIQISTNKRYGLDLTEVAYRIRRRELIRRGVGLLDDDTLRDHGTVAAVPQWFYFKKGEGLFNGTTTSPNVEPTALSLNDVRETVIKALAPASKKVTGNRNETSPDSVSDLEPELA